jgi:hypothetical protein
MLLLRTTDDTLVEKVGAGDVPDLPSPPPRLVTLAAARACLVFLFRPAVPVCIIGVIINTTSPLHI